MAASKSSPALVALIGGAIGIAFAPIFVRWSDVGPTSTGFFRLALAVPLLAVWAARVPVRRRPGKRWRLLIPGLCFALDIGVWHWSIELTSVANATLLANFAPVFVTLGGWVVFRRKFGAVFLAGLVIALTGLVILLGARPSAGDLLGLLTAVFYASYILSVGWLREEFATGTIMAWSTATAALLLLPVSLVSGEVFWPPTARAWLVLAGLALVSHVGGQGLIAYALAHLPAAFSSVTLLLQPVMAAVLAWLFFAEALTVAQTVGGAIVLAGIVVARRDAIRKRGPRTGP